MLKKTVALVLVSYKTIVLSRLLYPTRKYAQTDNLTTGHFPVVGLVDNAFVNHRQINKMRI